MDFQEILFPEFEQKTEENIFGKMTIPGDPPITFRHGVVGEEEVIQKIATEFSAELGWVRLPQIRLWIKKKWCIVAECEGKMAGFNLLTVVKKGRTGLTSNSICILPDYLRKGIGRKFREYAIELLEKKGWQTILAKCIESSRANYLNQSMGFKLIGFDPGKKRKLNIWCYYNKYIPEKYHLPDLSDQFDWTLITNKPTIEVERENKKKKERKRTAPRKGTHRGKEYIDSLPMDEIVTEYRRSTWKKMRTKLGYSNSVINRLRQSKRFRDKYPDLAK